MDIRWDQLTKPQWQTHLASQEYGLRQDWDFGLAMGQMGAGCARAVVSHRGTPVALAQVLIRHRLRVIGQGPVWLVPLEPWQKRQVIRQLAHYCGASIVTPREPLAGWGMIPIITAQTSALWHIGQSPKILRAGMHGKWRNRLLRAEGVVHPTQLGVQKLSPLIAMEAAQRSARGYRNLPGALAAHWQGGRMAIGWHTNGALQAGMVFLIHGQTASYFLGWASDAARKVFAHGPMLWQAALALRERGVQTLDLGEVNTDIGASLARFKLGTGAGLQTPGATCLVLPQVFSSQVTTRRDAGITTV